MYLLTEELRHKLPPLGTTAGSPLGEAVAYARFFDPTSNWKWYILEFDGNDTFLGIVITGNHALVGNFTLSELEALQYTDEELGSVGVERDPDFDPTRVGDLGSNEPAVRELFKESGLGLTQLEDGPS